MRQENIFEVYANLELSREQRIAIRNTKNELLKERLTATGEVFSTEIHEEVFIQACLCFGIYL